MELTESYSGTDWSKILEWRTHYDNGEEMSKYTRLNRVNMNSLWQVRGELPDPELRVKLIEDSRSAVDETLEGLLGTPEEQFALKEMMPIRPYLAIHGLRQLHLAKKDFDDATSMKRYENAGSIRHEIVQIIRDYDRIFDVFNEVFPVGRAAVDTMKISFNYGGFANSLVDIAPKELVA